MALQMLGEGEVRLGHGQAGQGASLEESAARVERRGDSPIQAEVAQIQGQSPMPGAEQARGEPVSDAELEDLLAGKRIKALCDVLYRACQRHVGCEGYVNHGLDGVGDVLGASPRDPRDPEHIQPT